MHVFCSFLKQSRAQPFRPFSFITRSISMDLMLEMVLQHQMPKFRIKHGKFHKETIHIPFPHPPHQFLSKMSITIKGLLKKLLSMLQTQIQFQPTWNPHSQSGTVRRLCLEITLPGVGSQVCPKRLSVLLLYFNLLYLLNYKWVRPKYLARFEHSNNFYPRP